jgi:hypothetical protein
MPVATASTFNLKVEENDPAVMVRSCLPKAIEEEAAKLAVTKPLPSEAVKPVIVRPEIEEIEGVIPA